MKRIIKKGITYAESKDADAKVRAMVEGMLDEITEKGDAAVRELSAKLDKWSPESFKLSKEQITSIIEGLPEQVIEDIKFAQKQIRNFAQKQRESIKDIEVETLPGVILGHKNIPVSSVGCYVPGGRYPMVASAHMSVLTAKVAGVQRVIACTPPINGEIPAATVAAMSMAGAEVITELGLHPGEDFVNNKNTYEKIAMLVKLANEAGKKASGANTKEAANDWIKKEADYNKQILELKNSLSAKDKEISAAQINGKKDLKLERRILAIADKLNIPAELDVDVKIGIVRGVIEAQLQKEGLQFSLDESNNLIVVDKDGKPAYNPKDNVAFEPISYIDGALAHNKLLKINDAGSGQQNNNNSGNNGGITVPAGLRNNQAISEEYHKQRESLPL